MPAVSQLKVVRPMNRDEIAVAQEFNEDDSVVYDLDDTEQACWLVCRLDGRPVGRVVFFTFDDDGQINGETDSPNVSGFEVLSGDDSP